MAVSHLFFDLLNGQYTLDFEEIGKGSFGIVYKGVRNTDGEIIAAKKIKYKDKVKTLNEGLSKMGQTELKIFCKLSGHENIVELLDHNNDGINHWFIMEFCDLGDLPEFFNNNHVDFNVKLKVIVDCTNAITYMHSFNPPIVHRDIKPTNVLIKRQGNEHVAKITDFGIGKIFEVNQTTLHLTMTTGGGTQSFMAPEFFAEDMESIRYHPGIDIFSLGLLFQVILLYDKDERDMTPLSVDMKKCQKYLHYGLEMVIADKNKQPMPQLFDSSENDSVHLKQLKSIVNSMTAFKENERMKPSHVKDMVLEIYNNHLKGHNGCINLPEDIKGHWRFENGVFKSIQELIQHQRTSGLPITKKSPAIIKKPYKENWELRCDDIDLGIKLADNLPVVDRPIQAEEWFLPREVIVGLLKNDGDFLVRENKNKKSGDVQFVLSVMWSEPKHFIIQGYDEHWRFENGVFNSIQELIQHHCTGGLPVTKRSQAIIKKAIHKESWELSNDDIDLGIKLADGNFSLVFKGRYKGKDVAIKTYKETISQERKNKLLQGGYIKKQYIHPNIVQCLGIAAQKQPLMVVMEYMTGGSLLDFLRSVDKTEKLKQVEFVQMCIDAAAGMCYLESNLCVHGSLAARNCLVGQNNVVKISDLTMAVETKEYNLTGAIDIPVKWAAPEAIDMDTFTTESDVWSFGILMWEIFSFGTTPYQDLTPNEATEKVNKGYRMTCPKGAPKDVHDLMLKCWHEEPEKRMKFEDIHKELKEILKLL